MERYLTLLLALLFDLLLGDPPNRLHPVAWMGTAIAAAKKRAPESDGTQAGEKRRFRYGVGIAAGGLLLSASVGGCLLNILNRLPLPLRIPLKAIVLKLFFSLGGLINAAESVEKPLQAGNLDEARHQLSWHLVSRDTSTLSESQVAAAAIESVAENASDSIVAPLFYFMIGGLPAAMAYRFSNTADAMLGYRDALHEWLGKAPARIDDLLNLIPARLTAATFVIAAFVFEPNGSDNGPRAWRTWRRDGGQTPSPNAGQPMSAAAGALGVQLDKEGHYSLGSGLAAATPADIGRSVNLLKVMTALFVVLLSVFMWLNGPSKRTEAEERSR